GQRRAVLERELRAGVADHVGDLVLGEARVDRHDDGAEHLRAEEGEDPVDAVTQADGDAVTARDPLGAKAAGDARRALPQLAVAARGAAAPQARRRRRIAFDALAEHRDQRVGQADVARTAGLVALHTGLVERVSPPWQWLRHDSLSSSLAQPEPTS